MHSSRPAPQQSPLLIPADGRARRLCWLIVLCALACSLRLTLYWLPPPELGPQAKYAWEEIHRGTTAWEWMRGPLLAPLDYQVNGYWGGSLVMSALAVPIFALWEPNLLALRLTTLPFLLLALVSLYVLVERFHGPQAARCAALLYALAPPGYVFLAACAWGTHIEAHAVALALAALSLRRVPEPSRLGNELWLGLLQGFAIYFGRSLLLSVAYLLVYEQWAWRRFSEWPRACLRALGIVLGIAPLLWLFHRHGWQGLALDHPLPWRRLGAVGDAGLGILHYFVTELPRALHFEELLGLAGLHLGRLVVFLLVGSCCVAIWTWCRSRRVLANSASGPRPAEAYALFSFALVHLLAFLLVHATGVSAVRASAELFEQRYALWTLPFLVLLAAGALGQGLEQARWPRVVCGLLAGLCVAGSFLRPRDVQASSARATLAYSVPELARFSARRALENPRQFDVVLQRLLQRRSAAEQRLFIASLGRYLGSYAKHAASDDPDLQRLAGQSRALLNQVGEDLPPDLRLVLRAVSKAQLAPAKPVREAFSVPREQ